MCPSPSSADSDPAPPPPALALARQDLVDAVQVALARDGHLLTAGEAVVARRLLSLPEPAASLYARLHGRRPALFRRDQLDYAEIPDMAAACAALVAAGMAWDDRHLPTRTLVSLHTVEGLKALCRSARLSTGGRREDLVARVQEAATTGALSREAVWLPALLPRHRGLFTRLCRLYLYDHSGDLSVLIVARLGHLRFPEYTPTGGLGLFPCRAELCAYEAALAQRWAEPDAATLIGQLPAALAAVEGRPMPADHRYRFSARRLAAEQALAAARELERMAEPAAAAAVYARLLAAGLREGGGAVAWRQAICLERLGQGAEAARLCAAHRDTAEAAEALSLERTGRRLARRHGVSWRPLPPLRAAPERAVPLPGGARIAGRPGYTTAAGGLATVEAALVAALQAAGRRAFFGEAAPWSTLFGLLCFEALYAPVPGMLPTPLLHGPLDLGAPGFAARRAPWLTPLLERIAAGEAPALLHAALPRLEGRCIAGVHWERFSPAHLRDLVAGIDGPSLSAILRGFAEDWRGASRGLPDLCILPGPALPAPLAVPEGLLLVEVKGPGDSLRDAQRIWIDRLLRLGVAVEVWKVHPHADADAPAGIA